jgi:PAS domain S-box-containing protein
MDLTPAPKPNDEILQTLLAYQAAINAAAIVSITDIKGNILYVNKMFIEISKYPAEELIGKNHRIINSGYHKREFFQEMWQTICAGKFWRSEIKNKAKDGSYYWVDTVITPIVDIKGRIFQFLSIRNLITEQKENEERLLNVQNELMKREKQLNEAQKVAGIGSWYMNIAGEGHLEWSDETYHIFEIASGTEMTYDKFLTMVHPADRGLVIESWQKALKTGGYNIEHRIVSKSGEKWVSERAHFEFNKKSNFRNALGTVQDITEKKKIENSLRDSEKLYKTLFNSSPFAIGIVDKNTLKILEVNETALSLYGYSRKEFLKLSAFDIRVPEEHDELRTELSGEYVSDYKTVRRHKKKDGEIMRVESSITLMAYKGHEVYLVTINDVTAKLKIEEELNLAEQNKQKAIIEAEEKSRSQIGMELHDNINQLLIASILYLQRIPNFPEESKDLLKTAMDIISNALKEIRNLSASLVTPILGNNYLKEIIEDLLAKYELLNVDIKLEININEEIIQQGLKTNIYRIIQEQVSNIIKHSEATKVRIVLLQYPDFIELEITDNGKGFNLKQAKKGIGLTNIIYRAEAYAGKASIITGINKGCKIKIRFNILQLEHGM